MNAEWMVTAEYANLRGNVVTLGLFTFEDDARAFAQSARRRYISATIRVVPVTIRVDAPTSGVGVE